MRETGCTDKLLNGYVLGDCASQFIAGKKTTYTLLKGNQILPLMRDAMNAVIEENTHFTQRCIEMLELLETDIAKALDISPLEKEAIAKEKNKEELLSGIKRYNRMLEKSCIQIPDTEISPEDIYSVKTIEMNGETHIYSINEEIMSGIRLLELNKEGVTTILDFKKSNDTGKTSISLNTMINNAQNKHNQQQYDLTDNRLRIEGELSK